MSTLRIDLETYSDVDIGKLGVYKYVDSLNFQILLMAYAIDDGPVKILDLKHGDKIPTNIKNMLFDKNVLKTAFNAQFERVCLNKYFGAETVNWECTMIKAWECGIGGGLASVGDAIGLPEDQQKMKEGKRLIEKFCKPNVAQLSLFDDKDWETFKEYCKRDVEVERKIGKKLERFTLPEFEKELYQLDQKINDRGIRLDMDMIQNAIKIDDDLMRISTQKYTEITGMDNPNSLKDIKDFIKQQTKETVKSITKNNLDELIEHFKEFPDVQEVLKIRKLLNKTSTAKYKMMQEVTMRDGRSRGNIQFFGAVTTGRWAGRLIQVHNLPQNHVRDLDTARHIVKYTDLEFMTMAYDSPPDILSQCIRSCIIPSEGKKFLVADFSAIEARVIAWLAGEDWVLNVFRGDGKIYEATAAKMFNVPVESVKKGSSLRQKGKVATLALGYQGGPGALISMGALKMGITEEELQPIVDMWRSSNKNIVKFWYDTQRAVIDAIEKGGLKSTAKNKIKIYKKSGMLWIVLPSGRALAYCKPKVTDHDKFINSKKITYKERNSAGTGWITRDTYGGRLVENIVQATARDCLAVAMLNLEKAGYKIVMHVHDEVIIEVDKDCNDLDKLCKLMSLPPNWAPDLPLNAAGYECSYYKKD